MPLIPAFGMPGFFELLMIGVLVLPLAVVLLIFLSISMNKKNQNLDAVADDKSSWRIGRWVIEVLKVVAIIGVCGLAWFFLR
ncbi:MAG: hypothetical protein CMM07_13525 [Rhodopirellula sp.]|nr:hypothetical protein [Rhodopirellula sp.]